MKNKTLKKENLMPFLLHLKERYEVIGPKKKGDLFVFDRIDDEIWLDYPTTMLPPKKLLFPPQEALYEYKKTNGGIELHDLMKKWGKKRVLFGVHPCDVQGLLFLDKVFANEFKDPYYLHRRKNTIIVCLTCKEPTEYCFCDATGTGPIIENRYDLLVTDLDDKYYFRSGSKTGEKILREKFFKDATSEDEKKRDTKIRELKRKLRSGFNIRGISEKMKKKFQSKLWGAYAEKCVLCGACNFTCPTCHCFTIRDETNLMGTRGERVRVWDACHFKNFALVAGGLNFREGRVPRVKLRVYDKLYYSMEKYGCYSCVGCGRCIEFCPARIDIREIIKEVGG